MFEAWDVAVDGPEPVPPGDVPVEPWQDCDDETWLEELVTADPERPRSAAEVLAEAEHGPISAALAAELGSLEVDTLDDEQKLVLAVAADRWVNHYDGVKLAAVGAFAGAEPRRDTDEAAFAWCEISAALTVGEGQARRMVHTGRRLRSHLRGTLAGMRAGEVSLAKARCLVEATATFDGEQCARVEVRVLPHARIRNPGNRSAAVARAVRDVDPDGWKNRREQKLRDIAMIRLAQGDGIADVLLRSLDALRVAAVLAWAADYLTGTPIGDDAMQAGTDATAPPSRHGAPAVVNVIINLPDLIHPAHGGAATVAGSGEPLPADAVADLLREGARIRFALLDTDGTLAGISRTTHDIDALTRALIALRDVTLRVPGGSTTAIDGQDLDHIDPDGPSDPANLHPPSRGWHRAKTFKHWSVTANSDRAITWTSRRARRPYTIHPFNYRDDP